MFGYIYLTTNTVNGKVYIGQHQAEEYDPSYIGSGTLLKRAVKKYGRNAFLNEMIDTAESREELDKKETMYISDYKNQYGEDCYNIAAGGNVNSMAFATKESHDSFVSKMTEINRKRCASNDFKSKISKANSERYKDPKERQKQSEKIRSAWTDEELRRKQSESRKEYFAQHPKDNSYLNRKCIFELNGKKIEFESVKALRHYLKNVQHYNPDRRTFHRLMDNGKNDIPFNPLHKNKFGHLTGMRIYYKEA